eukprot:TRINITY_DN7204_c0_g1_i3.p1 TRINITY_DN7204_c0_g1~~TRINITY_DN7204_c0_g1_i3.p1  ORF type:complete len:392 (+),score=71.27 TRINITY_DN7204_c0_g1_i3:884-2059(+)
MVSVNLEQLKDLRLSRLQSIVDFMAGVLKASHIDLTKYVKQARLDPEVGSWLSEVLGSNRPVTTVNRRRRMSMHTVHIRDVDLDTWDFDALVLSESKLEECAVQILKTSVPSLETLKISEMKLREFVQDVRAHYNKTSFHNFAHAITVLHACGKLGQITCRDVCSGVELVAMMFAALLHDTDHKGLSNSFHVNSRSDLANQYNDVSVLENHHACVGFRLLNDHHLLDQLNSQDYTCFRKTVVDCVLGTDMAVHQEQSKKLEGIADCGGFDESALQADPALRRFLMAVVLHTADLYSPSKTFDLAQRWAIRLQKEFNDQVKLEKQLGLPFQSFMAASGKQALYKGELGFIQFVAKPWYKQMVRNFPSLQLLCDRIDDNIQRYTQLSEVKKDV